MFSSSRDGELCRSSSPPYSCTSTTTELTTGQQIITATATDPFGETATHPITVNVVNRAPEPDILKPLATDSLFSHIPVQFAAFVPDPDETIPGQNVTWISSRDGVLGTGLELTHLLTAGSHTITLLAVDGRALTGRDEVTVTVATGAGLPTPQITAPQDGILIGPSQVITLEGMATDPEDGTLPGTSLEWHSSIDGFLGTGNSIQVTLSAFSDPCFGHNQHTITLKAKDSDGHEVTVKITINVGIFC